MQTMKTTVSTTALSILVALGVTACSSTPKDETNTTGSTQNTPINPQAGQNTQSDANAKAKSEANAKADVEAKSKQKRLEAERKAKAEAEAKAKAEKEQAEKEVKAKAEEQKRLEAEAAQKAEEANKAAEADKQRLQEEAAKKAEEARKAREEEKRLDEIRKHKEDEQNKLNAEKLRIEREIALADKTKLDARGEEWRQVDIRSCEPFHGNVDSDTKDLTTQIKAAFHSKLPEPYAIAPWERSVFKETSGDVVMNLSEISKNDVKKGGKFMGVHSGVYTDDGIDGVKVTKISDDVSDLKDYGVDYGGRKIVEAEDAQSVNYIFVNQPYSTYGALFTSEIDMRFFAMGLKTNNYGDLYHHRVSSNGVTTNQLVYNDNVKGEAIYKGDVIGVVSTSQKGTHIEHYTTPKLDGTVTLTANFGDRADKNYIQGHIDSNSVGRVELAKYRMGTSNHFGGIESNVTILDKDKQVIARGHYYGSFVGKDAQEVIGNVSVDYTNIKRGSGNIYTQDQKTSYRAVFGATRQPK